MLCSTLHSTEGELTSKVTKEHPSKSDLTNTATFLNRP